jgi:dolichol kinase
MVKSAVIFAVSFFVSIIVAFLSDHGFTSISYIVVLAAFSSILLIAYQSKRSYFYVSFVVISLFLILHPIPLTFALQVIASSLLTQALLSMNSPSRKIRLRKETEIRRDIVQLIIGALFLFIIYLDFKLLAVLLIFMGVITAHLILIYSKKIKDFSSLLERDGVIFGSGALFMSVGALLVMGFAKDFSFLFFGLFALLISDPIATIAGIKASKNYGKKSIAGSTAFFMSLLIPGFLIFNLPGLLFSVVITLAEYSSPIDDNLFIPLVTLLLSFLV